MMIPNIAGLIVGSIVLGILIKQNIVQQDISAIELTAIIITNIVYETFLMFLMGYGFIELPRSVWMQASLDSSLLTAQMKACSDFQDISESQTLMGVCVANVIKTRNEVCHNSVALLYYDNDVHFLKVIINNLLVVTIQLNKCCDVDARICSEDVMILTSSSSLYSAQNTEIFNLRERC